MIHLFFRLKQNRKLDCFRIFDRMILAAFLVAMSSSISHADPVKILGITWDSTTNQMLEALEARKFQCVVNQNYQNLDLDSFCRLRDIHIPRPTTITNRGFTVNHLGKTYSTLGGQQHADIGFVCNSSGGENPAPIGESLWKFEKVDVVELDVEKIDIIYYPCKYSTVNKADEAMVSAFGSVASSAKFQYKCGAMRSCGYSFVELAREIIDSLDQLETLEAYGLLNDYTGQVSRTIGYCGKAEDGEFICISEYYGGEPRLTFFRGTYGLKGISLD